MLDPKVILEDICDITGCQCGCYTAEELLDEITALCGEYLKSKSPYFIFDEDTGKYIERSIMPETINPRIDTMHGRRVLVEDIINGNRLPAKLQKCGDCEQEAIYLITEIDSPVPLENKEFYTHGRRVWAYCGICDIGG